MLYIWHVTIPADTAQKSKIEEKKGVRNGIVIKIDVKFPPGCQGLVYATVSHRLTQLMPFNVTGAARGDDETVSGTVYWELKEPKPELILRGWSPDTSYEHRITFRVTILPKSLASMLPVIELLTKFLQRIGAIS